MPGAIDERKRLLADSQFGAGANGSYAPTNWFVGILLIRGNPDGSGFSEPTIGVGSYARVLVANNSTNWPAAATVGGVTLKSNGVKITWPNPTGTWGKMVAVGLFTASTGLLPQYSQPAKTELTIQSGNTPVELDIGFLKIPW